MNSTAPPNLTVTADNYSSIPVILSWVTAVTSILAVAVKITTKITMSRKLATDDYGMLTSLLFSIGMVAAVIVQGPNGLGKRETDLTALELQRYQQSSYAKDAMYILSLTTSKLTVLVLLYMLTLKSLHRNMLFGTAGLIGLWGLSGLFVSFFQCSLPQPWAVLSSKCINQNSFWTYFGVMNIVTELILTVMPAVIINEVQLTRQRKIGISLIFAARFLVLAPIFAELYFRNTASSTSPNRTFDQWTVVVCSLLVQCLSIVTACQPYLKPFFISLESGMIRVDDTRRRGGTTRPGYYYQENKPNSNGSSKRSKTKPDLEQNELDTMKPHASEPDERWGGYSQTSVERGSQEEEQVSIHSTSRIIRATTTYEVSSKDRDQ
ncbi:hypothetical protein VHEMI02476 [[Torrubiella] hemipterigena]|uniref:Rhodopsin domain-containing protein n=1 Tax=[Torrubiella] hemipterigena TaxID=1531966 RepID=A0A0A1T8A2_9HYPO|nr:hypothetical protein VHEMI02476 [[Torrubiella] hemipterigena]